MIRGPGAEYARTHHYDVMCCRHVGIITEVTTFKALLATNENGKFAAAIQQIPLGVLPPGEVLVRVKYSSLNYKDGLAVTGKPGVIRSFPMVPGVDFAGVVEESTSANFNPGDEVAVTGCGTSEVFWGGYAELARLDQDFMVPVPKGMTLKQAMGIGTAGFTAMQSVMELEQHGLKPGGREVVVTGAAGGVGSVAIAILANLGYKAVASSGRVEQHDYLRGLGASSIIGREVLSTASKRPLEAERWAGAIDNVGGDTLAGLLRTMALGASVAACGVAGGPNVSTTVFPFILRGVNLLGIDSSRVPNPRRREIWARIMRDLPMSQLDTMIQVEPLSKVFELGEQILAGQIRGRTVIDIEG
jgi:acrylyl-CoA reductase (NADPH)